MRVDEPGFEHQIEMPEAPPPDAMPRMVERFRERIEQHVPGGARAWQHAVWFHGPSRVDRWLLYVQDSPVARGARGLARGTIFTRDGELVASVAQEGLARLLAPAQPQPGRKSR